LIFDLQSFLFGGDWRRVKILINFHSFSQEVRQAAEFLELPQLMVLLSNTQSNESFMNDETIQHYTAVSLLDSPPT
jgi:hypothetical protein